MKIISFFIFRNLKCYAKELISKEKGGLDNRKGKSYKSLYNTHEKANVCAISCKRRMEKSGGRKGDIKGEWGKQTRPKNCFCRVAKTHTWQHRPQLQILQGFGETKINKYPNFNYFDIFCFRNYIYIFRKKIIFGIKTFLLFHSP